MRQDRSLLRWTPAKLCVSQTDHRRALAQPGMKIGSQTRRPGEKPVYAARAKLHECGGATKRTCRGLGRRGGPGDLTQPPLQSVARNEGTQDLERSFLELHSTFEELLTGPATATFSLTFRAIWDEFAATRTLR